MAQKKYLKRKQHARNSVDKTNHIKRAARYFNPLSMEHKADLIEAASDGELWQLWYALVPSPNEMAAEIQRRLDLQSQGLMLPFTVIDNKNHRVLGMTTYMDIVANYKRLEIGWTWYRKSVQKTAVNTEAKLLLLTRAFESLQCVAVRFSTNFFNHRSRRAIERLGAKMDGVLRNHRIMRNGIVCDSCTYSIIQHEWPAVKINLQVLLGIEVG